MAKEESITTSGVVEQVLPNTMFKVKLDNGPTVLSHISGRMRQNKIQILEGDRVSVEMSCYDLTRGRIVYRGA